MVAAIVFVATLDHSVFPAIPSQILLILLGIAALLEFYGMFRGMGQPSFPVFGLLAGSAIVFLSARWAGNIPLWAFWGLLAVQMIFYFAIIRGRNLGKIGSTLFGIFYISCPLAIMVLIRNSESLGGFWGLIFFISIAKIGDMAAYFVGAAIGKHKMAPTISPNKSWEGAVASVLASMALGALFLFQGWLPQTESSIGLPAVLFFCLCLNGTAQISDLVESRLKRLCKVKDSAKYLSVMGGALDMIDSFLLAAPVYVLLWPILS